MKKKKKFSSIGHKGILLIEILLVVVILSVSLVLIINSLMSSLRATAISSSYTRAIFALDNKMFDLVLKRHMASSFYESGNCDKPFEIYQYLIETKEASSPSGQDVKGINEVHASVQWPLGKKQKKIKAITLLLDEEF